MKKTKNIVSQEVVTTYYNISKYREMIDGVNLEKEFYKKMLETFFVAGIFRCSYAI
ncbi:ABC exporter outer membrane component [Salmonella sp. NCTC 11881]|nr:ABC exporter outer membrane component [Salmonella sp. NCTC 11881]